MHIGRAFLALGLLALACLGPSPERYRLADSGSDWRAVNGDSVLEDLELRYPEFFSDVLDGTRVRDLDLGPLRTDIEHTPVDRRNFDSLNAIAIAYFEMNSRAQDQPGGFGYLGNSFSSAKLAAVPWSAYGRVEDGKLRDAILDFYADIASGRKYRSAQTAGRLLLTVSSLEAKESDPERIARIQEIVDALKTMSATSTPGS